MTVRDGALVLADGESFEGELFGAEPDGGVVSGEFVFNTTMTGYQEVISDPSYAGQIITFTTTHLGQLRHDPDRRRVTPAVLPGRRGAGDGPSAQQLAVHRGPRRLPATATASPPSAGSTPVA